MAVILNLETATTNCSVSLAKDGVLLAIKEADSANYSHSEQLHPFIEEVMGLAGMDLTSLDAIAVSKGPGSYTGLRIGVSAAKGLCYALDLPLIATSTLKSMALQHTITAGFLVPMLDARRMEVYSAVYSHDYRELRPVAAEVITPDSLGDYRKQGAVHLLGSGAAKCREVLQGPNLHFHEGLVPSAREMAGLSHERYSAGLLEDLAYFEPFYLKDFILKTKGN